MNWTMIMLLIVGIMSCKEPQSELASMQLGLVTCAGILPSKTDSRVQSERNTGLLATAELQYGEEQESSFKIKIFEYSSDFDAYAALLRHGVPSDGFPRIRGDIQETWFHGGKWVMSFQSNRFRPMSRDHQELFLRAFSPKSKGLPDLFVSLPVMNRDPQGASVSQEEFMGIPWNHKMLCQRYRDSAGIWYAARSVENVPLTEVQAWLSQVDSSASMNMENRANPFWDQGNRGWIGLHQGKLVVVWGTRDYSSLQRDWEGVIRVLSQASKSGLL